MPRWLIQGAAQGRVLPAHIVAGATFWICIALWQGYDFEWDVLNYHYYNGFAFLHGRTFVNVQPSMLQAYFAPLMDAVFYLLVRFLPPTSVLVTIAAFQSLAFPMLFQAARLLLRDGRAGAGLIPPCTILALLGITAPVSLWEAGGALGDTTSAVLVLAALLTLLHGVVRAGGALSTRRAALAGGLAGLAAGLKLTNLPFALGVLAVFTVALPLRGTAMARAAWLRGLAACAAGMGTAFLLTYGWWGALLWVRLGNPVFPNFNQLFRSPYAPAVSFSDPAFLLPTWHAKLFFPFLHTSIFGRLDPAGLFDVRMALACPLCLLGLVVPRRSAVGAQVHEAQSGLLIFVLVSYLGWLLVFPINRYLAVVDMVAPLACAVAAARLWRLRAAVWTATVALAIVLPASASTSMPLWWLAGEHRHGNEGGYFGIRFAAPPRTEGGLVAMLGGWPTTFLLPSFPGKTIFVRLQGSLHYPQPAFATLTSSSTPAQRRAVFGNAMGNAICRRLDDNKGALFLLRGAPDTAQDAAALRYFGIAQEAGTCISIASKSVMQLELCPAARVQQPECG